MAGLECMNKKPGRQFCDPDERNVKSVSSYPHMNLRESGGITVYICESIEDLGLKRYFE